jgi:DNA polymerase-3 subunit delta
VPLYVFCGADTFSRKEALDALKRRLDTDGALATNTTMLDARSATPQEVTATCDTIPFLGEHRLVILEGALSAGGAKKGRRRAAELSPDDAGPWGQLVGYIDRMPPSATLVILDEAPGGLIELLSGKGEVRKFPLPDQKTISGWVMNRAKAVGMKLDFPAAKLLAELIGSDTWMLASELDKLSAYAAGGVVREDDVRMLVSRAKEHKGWELADAVLEGQSGQALRLVQELLEDGEPWPVLLSTVAGRYRRIAIAKEMSESGASGSAIMKRLRITSDFALSKLLDHARRLSWTAIRDAYARIIEAELDVKRRSMDDRLALDLCIQDLAGRSAAATQRGRVRVPA